VTSSRAGRQRRWASIRVRSFVLAALVAIGLFFALIILTRLSALLSWIVAWTLVTFFVYGFDKQQAVRQRARVPERSLLAMGIAGGFLGALAGMIVFRHKTTKLPFWILNSVSAIAYAVWFVLTLR
jgi:uncharacterized membrane protein YsdA (DUF1294 family)